LQISDIFAKENVIGWQTHMMLPSGEWI